MPKDEKKQMSKNSIELSHYEMLFKHEFATFVALREKWKNSKTKIKKKILAKKISKQKNITLSVAIKVAQLKKAQEQLKASKKSGFKE